MTKILKRHFLKKGIFQISFLKSHNSVSFFEVGGSEKFHLTLNFSQIITLAITLYRRSWALFSDTYTL